MRIYKVRRFVKWARKEKISDSSLCSAVEEMEGGLIDANLGGNVYKKRVGLRGRGKSGGARTILVYRTNDRVFFIFGFAKSNKANVSKEEILALKDFAKELLRYDDIKIKQLLKAGDLEEIENG